MTSRPIFARIFALSAVSLVSACSGGAGGGTPPLSKGINAPAGGSAASASIPKQYVLTDLGTGLKGSPGLVPSAVNDSGVVVGEASTGILSSLPSCSSIACGPPEGWAFRNGALQMLPPLGSDSVTFADDINNAGVISGGSAGASGEEAVLWNPGGSIVNLGTGIATPGSSAEATAINNAGKIAGVSYNATTTLPTFFDGKGGASDPCGSGVQGYFRDSLNDAGVGAGDQLLSGGGTAAMMCPPFKAVETPSNPAFLDFGFAINNQDEVVGRFTPGSDGSIFHPFLYQNGTTTDIGSLFSGDSSAVGAAFAINNAGTIVGFSAQSGAVIGPPSVPPVNSRAFVYANGKMVDLNSLLPASCKDWTLVVASGINNQGQIVGSAFVGGYPNGVEHAFLLTPAP